jgi:hypothetical protein
MENDIDLWNIWANFFKSDPMYVFTSLFTIIGFVLTIIVYIRIKSINYSVKKLKRLEYYKQVYEELVKILRGKNIPTDIYQRVERNNKLLYHSIGYLKRWKIRKQFDAVDTNDENYDGLKAFLNEIIITLEKGIA